MVSGDCCGCNARRQPLHGRQTARRERRIDTVGAAASPYRGRCRGSNIENKENSCGIQAVHYQTLRDTHYFNRMVKARGSGGRWAGHKSRAATTTLRPSRETVGGNNRLPTAIARLTRLHVGRRTPLIKLFALDTNVIMMILKRYFRFLKKYIR